MWTADEDAACEASSRACPMLSARLSRGLNLRHGMRRTTLFVNTADCDVRGPQKLVSRSSEKCQLPVVCALRQFASPLASRAWCYFGRPYRRRASVPTQTAAGDAWRHAP
ncbi:hypothetical protein TRVL_02716 [Trypanosoma vivax]|nr:hypothetical protein TRVL_02716 [Trypanosoma vivax]